MSREFQSLSVIYTSKVNHQIGYTDVDGIQSKPSPLKTDLVHLRYKTKFKMLNSHRITYDISTNFFLRADPQLSTMAFLSALEVSGIRTQTDSTEL